jgi:hypothetical protein
VKDAVPAKLNDRARETTSRFFVLETGNAGPRRAAVADGCASRRGANERLIANSPYDRAIRMAMFASGGNTRSLSVAVQR